MSYGLMIAVQFGQKDIFDRLWRWSRKYMQHQSGPHEGYFAWSCKIDGTRNSDGAASDGELYFITALLFASNRWGNDTGIDYKAEAQRILRCTMPRELPVNPNAPTSGPFAQQGPQKSFLIDPETRLITFTPEGFGQRFTDPSYHIPASTKCGHVGPTTDAATSGSIVQPVVVPICTRCATRSLV